MALDEGDGLTGECHRRQRLAEPVEQGKHELLAGDRPRHQTGGPHRFGEHLAAGTAQEGAVKVEERGARW